METQELQTPVQTDEELLREMYDQEHQADLEAEGSGEDLDPDDELEAEDEDEDDGEVPDEVAGPLDADSPALEDDGGEPESIVVDPVEAPLRSDKVNMLAELLANLQRPSANALPVAPTMTVEQALALSAELDRIKGELARLQATPKNHQPGKPGNRTYERIGEFSGKAPQQQQDLARILAIRMEPKKKYTEAEVFQFVSEGGQLFESIRKSVQDPTYLFRYYRNIKHTGFVARDFLRVS